MRIKTKFTAKFFEINQGSFADSPEKHVLTSCFTDHHHFISAVLLVPLRSHRIQLFVTFETSLFEKIFMNYIEPLLPHWLYIWIWSSTPKQSSEHKPLWITRRWPSDDMPQIIMHLGVNSTKFWKRHTGTVKKEKVRFSFSEKQIFKKAQHPNTFYFSYTV